MKMKNQYYITCFADNDYQININYPHQIRRRLNKLIVKESLMNNIYYCYNLNQVTSQTSHLVDPINKVQIDHIDRDKLNNEKFYI